MIKYIKKETGVHDPLGEKMIVYSSNGMTSPSLCVALRDMGNKNVRLFSYE